MNPLPLHRKIFRLIFAVIIGIAYAACAPLKSPVPAPPPTTAATVSLGASPTVSPRYLDPSAPVEERVADLLARMTLDEKIGQMTQVERSVLDADVTAIARYGIGSVLSGGGSAPSPNTPEAWADMYDRYQKQALSTRLGIPLIYGIDAVHGHNNVRGAVVFPHNIGLGATRDPGLVEEVGRITAMEVAGTGIDWTFSPCVAVPQDERWGRTYEGFGEDPELVATMAVAIIRGYQGDDLSSGTTILATAKHYVGDGGTAYGTGIQGGLDQGDTRVDEATLRRIHLTPYVAAVDAGVGSIMASFSSWNGQKMHGNRYLLTEVLRGELGFWGLVVSDWQAIDQLPGDYRSDVKTAINAGIDMVMVPYDYVTFINTLRQLVNDGEVPMERIDEAVGRILWAKFALGLFEHPYTDRTLTDRIGSPEHREVARRAVRQSLVLLRNENNLLPLPKNLNRIVVAGSHADNLGYQCGGWTITWQGGSGDITEGTTILQAIRNTVSVGTVVDYTPDGSGASGAAVGIVVIGETPYAEFEGDRSDLALSPDDLRIIQNIKAAGVPVVVILVTGRPLIIEPYLEDWDALLVAWLPGTEGQGVADVLFGDYAPTGKLPCSWPRTMEQIPINIGDSDYDPLFPYGFGLSYPGQ